MPIKNLTYRQKDALRRLSQIDLKCASDVGASLDTMQELVKRGLALQVTVGPLWEPTIIPRSTFMFLAL
jgi:hypothetical protein